MKTLSKTLSVSLSVLLLSSLATAQDGTQSELLSDAVGTLIHPVVDDQNAEKLYQANAKSDLSKSDIWAHLEKHTNVKTQGSRNTCTVFAMTGLLESLYLIKNPQLRDVDFSEQFMQYWVAVKSPTGGEQGSTVPNNFGIVKKRGLPTEAALPYDGSAWSLTPLSKASRLCGHLKDMDLTRCLNSHRSPELARVNALEIGDRTSRYYDPEFSNALASAKESQASFVNHLSGGIVGSTSEIKSLMRRGLGLTLEINVYYGSWNLSSASKLGIDSDSSLYRQGVVTYPERGSVDLSESPKKPARHAVVLVGYDDNVVLTYERKMQDGTTKTFTRKGVYYFKNSWGKKGHGQNFKIDGKKIPGFGMISQDYANTYGQFFSVKMNGVEL